MRELSLLELNRRLGVQADPQRPEIVKMWVEDVTPDKVGRLPFNRPSGSQSGAIGPVFKRSHKKNESPPFGPSTKIQETTRKDFEQAAASADSWSAYFREIACLLFQPGTLAFSGSQYLTGPEQPFHHPLAQALHLIPETTTVFVAAVDGQDRWPGERPEYQEYLAHALADIKYVTGAAPVREHGDCPLCGAADVTLYPNAVKGAGLNFGNMDRVGAFPGLDIARAWKGYALCVDCADLLYIFKFHLLDQFLGPVAGERALLLPALLGNPAGRRRFMKDWDDYLRQIKQDTGRIGGIEADLMEFFAGREDAQLVLNILWASFGQLIDDCRGYATDILPSRLQDLAKINARVNDWRHALAPRLRVSEADLHLDLGCLRPLLRRPGGKAAAKANSSPQLFALKRELAEALYHGRPLIDPQTLWGELLVTARWYLREAVTERKDWGLTNEGVTKKDQPYWTLTGWVRHLARFLHYLHETGVLPMSPDPEAYAPRMEALKPFFAAGSGIDRPEKAFTFLLGILYGKLLQVQGARGVNVGANALTWLKRLNLSGRDLPGLYNRIREKLLSYETESSAGVRDLVRELGALGARLGDHIELDTTATCYFLLLGQSVAVDVLPSQRKDNGDHDQ